MKWHRKFCQPKKTKPTLESLEGKIDRLDLLVRALDLNLATFGRNIMTVLDDYLAKQAAFNTDVAADLTAIKTNQDATNAALAALQAQVAAGGLTQAQTDAIANLSAAIDNEQPTIDALAGKVASPPAPPPAASA